VTENENENTGAEVPVTPAEAAPTPAAEQVSAPKPTAAEIEDKLAKQLAELENMPTHPELEDQPQEEVFGGEMTSSPNIDIGVEIFEEATEEELDKLLEKGSFIAGNDDHEMLDRIYTHITTTIVRHQAKRKKLVDVGQGGHLLGAPIDDRGTVLFVTEKERTAMAAISYFRKMARHGLGKDLFEQDQWTNLPQVGEHILAPGKTSFENSNNERLKMRGALGMSGEFPTPLWSTGMHLKTVSPGAIEGLRLETKIALEKIEQARDTLGYSLSASEIYMNIPVIEFCLDRVISSTLGTTNRADLEKVVLLTDLEPLAGSVAASMYPDGFVLERPCLKSNGGCGTVVRRKIQLRRGLFVRWERVSEHQKNFMTKRSGRHDVATIRNYQDMTRPDISRLVDLGGGYKLRLQVPTIAQYKRIAGSWMSNLTNGAKDLIVSNANRGEREDFIERQANIALIMAYAHWIVAFEHVPTIDAPPKTVVTRLVTDPDEQYAADQAVDQELIDLSADGGQTQRIVAEIRKFINDMTLAVFAIPKTCCPNPECGKSITGDDIANHPALVQVNTVELFFTLLRHKIRNSGK
jgi:uncharacterized protein YuzB (UPF0349 family)